MRIGIVGAGNVGRLYGRVWLERGHEVAFSYTRDARSLASFVQSAGPSASAVPMENLSESSDVIVFCPPFERIADAAARLGDVDGKIVIDTTNPFNPERSGLVDLGGSTANDHVAALLSSALLVKGLHNLSVEQAETAMDADPAAIFLASDSLAALGAASRLFVDAGLIPIITGPVSTAA